MRRFLAVLVFATAAAAATAAGAGVVVGPHVDPPGIPPHHSHLLAAYRIPLFLGALGAGLDEPHALLSQDSVMSLDATMLLALLALLWPQLPRPTLRPTTQLAVIRVAPPLWQLPPIAGPPRATLHAV